MVLIQVLGRVGMINGLGSVLLHDLGEGLSTSPQTCHSWLFETLVRVQGLALSPSKLDGIKEMLEPGHAQTIANAQP